MRNCLLILFSLATIDSYSQGDFPDLSPKGSVKQKIGFTTVSVDYERPAARGRKIFGELVPYDKLWRTGAGNSTKIRFSEPVMIDDKKVTAGTYSVFTIPDPNEWTVILNNDTTLYGTQSYDQSKDVLRFKTKPEKTSRHYESFTIDIDVIPNNAMVYLAWEHTEILLKVETGTDNRTNDFINNNLLTNKSNDSDQYATAVEYYYFLNKNLDKALILVDKAIALKPKSWYYGLKIDILEKLGKYNEAIETANSAFEILQNDAKEYGWNAETLRIAKEETKSRIESLKVKLKNK
jgi:tetratricopeptide (TPR) repeat protein